MFTPVSIRSANSYRNVGLETSVSQASPHHLVGLLFDGLIQSLNATKGHIQSANFEEKGRSVGRAVRILEEGLKAALDMQNGGEIAANLRSVYDFCILASPKPICETTLAWLTRSSRSFGRLLMAGAKYVAIRRPGDKI